ncbi:MAG: histidine phosphatase family protein [Candidatus Binataceae bacterium]
MAKKRTGRLIMVRHGESVGNRERRFTTTPATLPLTDTGRRQALEAGRRIAQLFSPHLVISSPFARARDTAGIIAEVLGLPLEIEHALHERDMGEFAGELYDAMLTHSAFDPARPWLWKPPRGESFEDVKRRTAPVLDRLAIEHGGREVIVVSHGGVMMSLWAHVTGNWKGATVVPNCGIILIEHAEGRYHPPKFIEN